MATEAKSARVLSVQSSVVYGYVGNKSAVFPLQMHGFDVDPINSVQLSNHTGYSKFTGSRATGEELDTLLDGIEANGFLPQYSHVLSGYMGTLSFLSRFAQFLDSIKKISPDIIYVCDPVLGDDGALYVPESFVEVYREVIIPHATILTPNATEASVLSGLGIATLEDAARNCLFFHAKGVKKVVITSMSLPGDEEHLHIVATSADSLFEGDTEGADTQQRGEGGSQTESESTGNEGNGLCFAHLVVEVEVSPSESALLQVAAGQHRVKVWHASVRRFQGYVSGSGDLTAALLLAWTHTHDFATALRNTFASVHGIVERTFQAESKELLMIRHRDMLLHPPR